MVEIIRHGSNFEHECKECGCVFRFMKDEAEYHEDERTDPNPPVLVERYYTIDCPCCKERCYIHV